MSIPYTFEIVSVNPAARCMEIIYRSDGHQTMHIGARLPFEGENLEAVIQMYAPIAYWEEQQLSVVVPQVGTVGSWTPPAPVPSPTVASGEISVTQP